MSIMDTRGQFGVNFDLDQETGTYLFTNQIDLGAAGRDPGNGHPVYLNLVVTEAFTDGGDSATVQFRLRSDDSASIHATTSTGHFETPTILKEALPAGATFSFLLPVEGTAYERYLGLQAVVATAGFDSGMVTAWLGDAPIGGDKVHPGSTGLANSA